MTDICEMREYNHIGTNLDNISLLVLIPHTSPNSISNRLCKRNEMGKSNISGSDNSVYSTNPTNGFGTIRYCGCQTLVIKISNGSKMTTRVLYFQRKRRSKLYLLNTFFS